MKKLTMIAALACAIFTSCSNNEETEPYDGQVRFSAGIDQTATPRASRAAGTTWADTDEIGIFMVAENSTTVLESAENVKYTVGEDVPGVPNGKTFVSTTPIYYPMNDAVVDFIAYYPWTDGYALGTPINVQIPTTQTSVNQPRTDLLYVSGVQGQKSLGGNAVKLEFQHKLAKLVMNCTVGDGLAINDLAGMKVSINGMNTKNTFDLASGTLGTPETVAAITPRNLPSSTNYDAIILPAAATAAEGQISVEFTISTNEKFVWELPSGTTFNAGNEYIYTVTITRTKVIVEGTIKPWNTNTQGLVGTAD